MGEVVSARDICGDRLWPDLDHPIYLREPHPEWVPHVYTSEAQSQLQGRQP